MPILSLYDITDNSSDIGFFSMHSNTDGLNMPVCHVHAQYELLLICSGKTRIFNNADAFDAGDKTMVFHNANTFHRAEAEEGHIYDRYVMNFSPSCFSHLPRRIIDLSKLESSAVCVISLDDDTFAYLHNIARIIEKEKRPEERYLLLALYIRALTDYMNPSNTRSSSSVHTYIDNVIDYINENYQHQLTLESIADHFFISRAKLVADFKRATSVTVRHYIIAVRISNAKRLLRAGMSVTKTSEACGFGSDSHFITTFREYTGMTPKTYISRINYLNGEG